MSQFGLSNISYGTDGIRHSGETMNKIFVTRRHKTGDAHFSRSPLFSRFPTAHPLLDTCERLSMCCIVGIRRVH